MYQKDQLCMSCKNACGGCSWSSKLVPIDGWSAVSTKLRDGTEQFKIKQCPEYIFDGTCLRCKHFNKNDGDPQTWFKRCKFASGLQGFGDCKNYINIWLDRWEKEPDNEWRIFKEEYYD